MVSYNNHKIIKKNPLNGLLSETRKIYVHAAISANATSVIQAGYSFDRECRHKKMRVLKWLLQGSLLYMCMITIRYIWMISICDDYILT